MALEQFEAGKLKGAREEKVAEFQSPKSALKKAAALAAPDARRPCR
jgi:hypothetical protein